MSSHPSLLNPTPPALLLHAYRIRLRTTGPVHFSAFPGPVLRGALGDDPAVYAALFHPPPLLPQRRFADPPRPVTLRPRFGAGEYGAGSALELELDVTLVGAAAGALPAVIRALGRLGERGVGPSRHEPSGGRFELERVDAVGPGGTAAVVEPDGRVRPATLPWRFPDDFAAGPPGSLVLELCTPTFVRRGGDARGTLAFRDLVGDLLSRVSLLGQAYGDGAPFSRETERELLAAAQGVALADAAVRWLEVPRYSRT